MSNYNEWNNHNENPDNPQIRINASTQLQSVGDVYFGPTQGVVYLFEEGTPGLNNVIPTKSAMKSHNFNQDAPLFLNGDIIGYTQNITYSPANKRLILYFRYNEVGEDMSVLYSMLKQNNENLTAIPTVSTNSIKCVYCDTGYEKGSEACKCIDDSPYILINNFQLEKVSLFYPNEKGILEASKNSQKIKNAYFCGAISHVIILDEI